MNETEYKEWQIKAQQIAQDYLFSIGQPLVYKKDGVYIAEFSHGIVRELV